MTKARNYLSGRTYHITHRCHNRAFFLRYAVDRNKYLQLMWVGSRRHPVSFLAYTLTCNHVHLLLSAEDGNLISGLMEYVSGGMSRHYNRRKLQVGSFWEGRYRSTLIQDGHHLGRCLFYIDLNMVRAGVVDHPREWRWGSYHELAGRRKRYRLLDFDLLMRKLACDEKQFSGWYKRTLAGKLSRRRNLKREPWWSEAGIVGDYDFVAGLSDKRRQESIVKLTGDTYCI